MLAQPAKRIERAGRGHRPLMQEVVHVHKVRRKRPPTVEQEGVELPVSTEGVLNRHRLRLRHLGLGQTKNGGLPIPLQGLSQQASWLQCTDRQEHLLQGQQLALYGLRLVLDTFMKAYPRLKWNFLPLASQRRNAKSSSFS